MRTTIDHEHRAVLLPPFAPGDVVEMEMEGVDAWVVRRVQPATFSGPLRLVESAGELRAAGGPVLTNDEVRRLIGDDP